ncbi:hypothetical protein [Xanthomonas phaseoli]|uniref:hypothetical protein n=1 Tax=Xanthomonas phaseoli TaxID=1985254 RepID=UPI001237E06E|nr:hypothetical protein [Xanthomonas phaseoli]MBO9832572.1 hypothetical protein [Xanthomonas phaseoli pv. dieffenbachiae]MBO9838406.1 hypothetical protein [Xanthomonas phaseoli pv. dieffenbachiae]MBO9839429.1 hypothetical protein [Xanthomonas phaseoli pv. dieffenbachiae]MBO9861452.1 hypothetical protein [Xanthomonas phaseoli pv. dieffenbachiae]MBO9864263.1 hypothetical protein [Xanthomonas phaseoli pv. dieffenbachiae]
MKWFWRAAFAAALSFAGADAHAAQSAPVPVQPIEPIPQTATRAAPPPAAQPLAIKPAQVDSTLTPAELRIKLDASELRLRQAMRDSRATGWLEKLWPALLGLTGVLVGGVINIWLHGKQRVATEKANRASAAFEAQTQIIEYRSRQAHEFYYPLLLSLQRSSGVRRQICDHLHTKSPARFRFLREADGQEHEGRQGFV